MVDVDIRTNEKGTSKRVTLTLDDSSGRTIEVKVDCILPYKREKAVEVSKPPPTRHAWATTNYVKLQRMDDDDAQQSESSGDESDIMNANEYEPKDKHVFELNRPTPAREPVALDTMVANVKVTTRCNDTRCRAEHITIDGRVVDVATVIKAKGTLQTWKDTTQLRLARTSVVRAVDEEARVWMEYSTFCHSVLSRPWALSSKQIQVLEDESRSLTRKERETYKRTQEKARKRQEKRREIQDRISASEARAEQRRQAMVSELNGNPLDRYGWKPTTVRTFANDGA